MTVDQPLLATAPASEWSTRERILAELILHGVAVPDLAPSSRFVAVARLAADYRPIARAFDRLESALRWLQQTESEHAIVDLIVDLNAPSLETAAIRPFHVLTADETREPLDLNAAPPSAPASLGAPRSLATHPQPLRRRGAASRRAPGI